MCAEPPDVFEVDNPLGSGGRDAHAYREKYPHTTGWREKKKEDSDERMPGQSGFLPPRDLVLAEELQAAASGSGQLRQQQLRGRGRSSRVPGAHDRSPCLRRV